MREGYGMKKKPKFLRSNVHSYARLKNVWRKPKGMHNKLRHQFKGYGNVVNIGYGAPLTSKFLHKSGKEFVLVHNSAEAELLVKDKHMAIISKHLGQKKRLVIIQKLAKKSITIHNIKDIAKHIESINTDMQQRKDKKKKLPKQKPKEVKKKEEKQLTDEEKKKQEKAEKDKVLTKRQL
jgi:large subunit ribosomal protein L32e